MEAGAGIEVWGVLVAFVGWRMPLEHAAVALCPLSTTAARALTILSTVRFLRKLCNAQIERQGQNFLASIACKRRADHA